MEKLFNVKPTSNMTEEEIEQEIVEIYNQSVGDKDYLQCDKCKNRGDFLEIRNGVHYYRDCSCVKSYYQKKQIESIGVDTTKTFDNFIVKEPYQKQIYNACHTFIENNESWLYVSGQVGSGKTHACGATLLELIKQGNSGKYMKWKDDVIQLKRSINDNTYDKLINDYIDVDVLYIDDLFKTTRGSMPTSADADIAYKILDARNSRKLKTIISCELYLDEIDEIDEAVASRIEEYAIQVNIKRDKQRDFRKKREMI
jgi:DNA replication protein DnaC